MTKAELFEVIEYNTVTLSHQRAIKTAVEAYSSASNDGKPLVSGSLPVSAVELLTEVRHRLLVDIDQDGEPRSSMAELLAMWDKVNNALNLNVIGNDR